MFMFDMFHVFLNGKYQDTSECFELYVYKLYSYNSTHSEVSWYLLFFNIFFSMWAYTIYDRWSTVWNISTHAYSFEAVIDKVHGRFLDCLWKGDWTTTSYWKVWAITFCSVIPERTRSMSQNIHCFFFWCKESASIEGLLILKHTTDRPCSSSQISGGEML